nr:PD-(D/E)XK nuclease family protein [Parasporobacterium sp.]
NYTLDKKELFKEADESLISAPKNGYIEEDTKNGFRVVKLGRVSPTALHNMMECAWKFDYYIKYFESHNIEKNVMVWLPPNEKGNLFHQVFQEYCDAMLKGKKLNTSDALDLSVLKDIFDNAVAEFEMLVAKGSNQAYDMEKALIWEQIKEYMEALYADLKNSSEGWAVKECEREFETDNIYIDETGEYVSSDGSCDVIEFSYHGFLDRIDSYIDDTNVEHARIIDYKTGKKDNLEKKIKNNTQIQHAIYSMAVLEEVDYFSYDFPCDNNLRIEKKDKDISELPKVFRERMADILLNNNYNLYNDSACEYCDYKNICVHRMNLD